MGASNSSEKDEQSLIDHFADRCFYFSISRLLRSVQKLAEIESREIGLAPTYCYLIYCIHEKPGLTLSQTALVMNLEKSSASRMIQKLVDSGYVLEQRKGRSLSLTLTGRGKELIPKLNASWRDLNERFTKMIGEEEAEDLQRTLSAAAKKCD